ncbi:MAG TPA: M20 family metallopeptidase [Clostridia bacterium]|nr:M20 family metallopeptidase [Clostridia bacterium]
MTAQAEVIRLAQELVRIPSENPTGSEEAVGDYVFHWLGGLDVEVRKEEVEPGRFNVVARLEGATEHPRLVYTGHLDTVPSGEGWTKDPFSGEIVQGNLYGRGSADMKGGLAAALIAFKRICLRREKPCHSFVFLACVDEEGPFMKGALSAVEKGWVTGKDFLLAAEPSGLAVLAAHKGPLWFEITTQGKMAHAGKPHLGVDAIHAMAEVITSLKRLVEDLLYDDSLLGKATLNVGRINGGVKINMVPDTCRAEADLRLTVPMTVAQGRQLVEKAIAQGTGKVPGSRGSYRVLGVERPPQRTPQDSPLLAAVTGAVRKVTGGEAELSGFPAYTDGAIMAARTGTPHCLTFGPGYLAQAHAIDEYVPIEHLILASDILTETALEILF